LNRSHELDEIKNNDAAETHLLTQRMLDWHRKMRPKVEFWSRFSQLPYFEMSEKLSQRESVPSLIDRNVCWEEVRFSFDCSVEAMRGVDLLLGIVVKGRDLSLPRLRLSHSPEAIGEFERVSEVDGVAVWVWKSSALLPYRHLTHTRVELVLERESLVARCLRNAEVPRWLEADLLTADRTCQVAWLGCHYCNAAEFLDNQLWGGVIEDVYPLRIWWGVASTDSSQKPRDLRDWSAYRFPNERPPSDDKRVATFAKVANQSDHRVNNFGKKWPRVEFLRNQTGLAQALTTGRLSNFVQTDPIYGIRPSKLWSCYRFWDRDVMSLSEIHERGPPSTADMRTTIF
jgi:hypothetical protein